jgi:hypothetical protein
MGILPHVPTLSHEDSTRNFEVLGELLPDDATTLEALKEALEELTKDSGWIEPALVGGWEANAPIAYRKQANVVRLKGRAKTGASGTEVFTLPAGFRPTQALLYPAGGGGPSLAAATIATSGVVTLYDPTSTADVGLDGISFTTD